MTVLGRRWDTELNIEDQVRTASKREKGENEDKQCYRERDTDGVLEESMMCPENDTKSPVAEM